jgi:GH24 family phage-related lysozyme (muramidase)
MNEYKGSVFRDPFGQLTDGKGRALKQVEGGYVYAEAEAEASSKDISESANAQGELEGLKAKLTENEKALESAKQASADAEIRAANAQGELEGLKAKLGSVTAEALAKAGLNDKQAKAVLKLLE